MAQAVALDWRPFVYLGPHPTPVGATCWVASRGDLPGRPYTPWERQFRGGQAALEDAIFWSAALQRRFPKRQHVAAPQKNIRRKRKH